MPPGAPCSNKQCRMGPHVAGEQRAAAPLTATGSVQCGFSQPFAPWKCSGSASPKSVNAIFKNFIYVNL